jgi:putative ABC transport system permease protein
MFALREDLRFAFRVLAKKPAWTAAAIVAFGLGIGFNTAMYSTADGLLFRPLGVPQEDRLVSLAPQEKDRSFLGENVSVPDYLALKERARGVEDVTAWTSWDANLTGQGSPTRVSGYRVSASMFRALRLAPAAGNFFDDSAESPGHDRVVVLSYPLWESRFGADPAIVGRSIQLDGQPYLVLGVAPDRFRYPPTVELWTPLALSAAERQDNRHFFLGVFARLRPGVTIGQADADAGSIAETVARQYPDTHRVRTIRAVHLTDRISGDLTSSYTRLMLASAGFLLLIVCANVANLQFARSAARSREIAIRSALGAARGRIVRQLLVENLLLAFAGAAIGMLFAVWTLDLMRSTMTPEVEQYLPGWRRIGVNAPTLIYTVLLTTLAGIAAGLAPSLLLARTDIVSRLKDAARGSSSSSARHRMRSVLVVAEIVMALILVVGAFLMVRGVSALTVLLPGLEPEHVLTFRTKLPADRYASPEQIAQFHSRLLDRLGSLPSVETVGIISSIPYGGSRNRFAVSIHGRPADPAAPTRLAQVQSVNEGYFRALRIPVRAGRSLADSDISGRLPVAVVSESFVREYFPQQDPLGRVVELSMKLGEGPSYTIVGVAGDILHEFVDRTAEPVIYRSYLQAPRRETDFALRVAGDPRTLLPAVRDAVNAIDPQQPLYSAHPYRKMISDSLLGLAYVAGMLAVLGGVALFLAVIGVYGLMAHAVEERIPEIGIRVALGASSRDVLWMLLRRGLMLTAAGLAIGLPAAFASARLLSSLIFGVSSRDPVVFLAVPVLLAGCAMLACWIPVRRALRTDPVVALRYE